MHIAATIAQIYNHQSLTHSVTQSVQYEGIELLGQLKRTKFLNLVSKILRIGKEKTNDEMCSLLQTSSDGRKHPVKEKKETNGDYCKVTLAFIGVKIL